ncbi:MAG: hypothetical protein BWY31_00705 [Lentisphaerae bacterium ADurb.Bin242]|nr:MAG: hypothetical protein BWY31_00705 [Lentisphaerae bacterium ADurb.Bin242]
MKEENYDFRKRRTVIHLPGRRDFSLSPGKGQIVLNRGWRILLSPDPPDCMRRAASDLQDFLFVSMEVSVRVEYEGSETEKTKSIRFAWNESIARGYDIEVAGESVLLSAGSVLGILQAGIALEDRMNLAEAPFLNQGVEPVRPRLHSRQVHSGCGIDEYPDCELNAILHAGYDTIVVFIKGIDRSARGFCNLNELIARAAGFGLRTLLYNYMESFKHPDDPDAEAFFDSVYGEFFRHVHGASAIMLCGESLEFPSRDPATTGKPWHQSVVDGIPDVRPSPGWYPCEDYPRYLRKIREAIHRADPGVEVSFSTYNWGYAPFELRRHFLQVFPKELTVEMPFENFKVKKEDGLSRPVMDYTISEPEPGYYFLSEAEEAHRNGLSIAVISNTAGATWDFGTVPYVPVPYCWLRRLRALNDALEKWNVDRYYETHHYGWQPNVVTELCKRYFVDPQETNLEALLEKLAAMQYGREAAEGILGTWRLWSDAMNFYVASNEDQYGPWRTGPSYPFIFQPNITRTMTGKEIQFPTAPHAHFGHRIIQTMYQPFENENQSPGFLRYPKEIGSLEKMLELWNRGLDRLKETLPFVPPKKRAEADRLEALGHFIRNSIVTTLHMKRWWRLNMRLQIAEGRKEALEILDRLFEIADAEAANALDTIPCVETDSRLGWEPSMEYVCDRWHLEWKLRQLDSMKLEMETYRKMINL